MLVYRPGLPAVSALQNVINRGKRVYRVQIDVCELKDSDLVTFVEAGTLLTYRQFIEPSLMLEKVPMGEHAFNLTFTNDPQQRYFYLSQTQLHSYY